MTTPDEYRHQYAKSLTDHGAFVKAMHASPSDDLPALVYADYLDDHGDAGAAEVIRRHRELGRHLQDSRVVTPPYSGDLPEDGSPFVEFYETLPAMTTRGRHYEGDDDGHDGPRFRLNVMHRAEDTKYADSGITVPQWVGHGVRVGAETAHRLVSNMPNVHNAEKAKGELERRFPWLKAKE